MEVVTLEAAPIDRLHFEFCPSIDFDFASGCSSTVNVIHFMIDVTLPSLLMPITLGYGTVGSPISSLNFQS